MPELTGPSADESFNHIGNTPTPSYYWFLHMGGQPNKADPRLPLLGSQQVRATNPPEYHGSHDQVPAMTLGSQSSSPSLLPSPVGAFRESPRLWSHPSLQTQVPRTGRSEHLPVMFDAMLSWLGYVI